MEGLKVRIIEPSTTKRSGILDSKVGSILIMLFLLLLVPVIIVVVVFLWLYSLFHNATSPTVDPYSWSSIPEARQLGLAYKYVRKDDVPEILKERLTETNLVVFKTKDALVFFEGFFTDFIIKRNDGIFVQKLLLNEEGTQTIAEPLYFYSYSTGEWEEIRDFKGYVLHSKGNPDNFILMAESDEDSIELQLSK